ncbi:MAG: four helix bundle protein [Oscillospiraceae bacterium]|nr:four helix bundle protein [Oscillospiraceae bacterium]
MAWTHYSEMIVWQKAMDLVDEVYRLVRLLPKEETYALADQMRRAVVSIPSNIAEGHSRQSQKDFGHFLVIAKGSIYELETQIHVCLRQQFFVEEQASGALSLCDEVSRMLTALIKRSR